MPEYMIAFNDEWVGEHTPEDVQRKGEASRALLAQMQAEGVFLFGNGGIDASTVVGSVVARGDAPVYSDGPYAETKEHLGGFVVIDVPDDATARGWAERLALCLGWPQEIHRFPGPGMLGAPARRGLAAGDE